MRKPNRAEPSRVNITEPWLTRIAAKGPSGGPQEIWWDEELAGFGVVVGRRFATFIVQHRVNGVPERKKIGRHGHPGAGEDYSEVWTVTRARKAALRKLGAMSNGVSTKTMATEMVTLRAAFEEHKKRIAKKVKAGKRSQATIDTIDKTMARREVMPLLDRPLVEIDGQILGDLHEAIKRNVKARSTAKNEKGAPVANRVIANISAAWGTMNKRLGGKLGSWNPAKAVDRDTLVAHRTRIGNDDLPDWYARAQTMRNPVQRDGLLFALFTGLRNEDVRTARFENVDAKASTLRLPDPKGGPDAAFTIPLSKTCLEIIARRRKGNPERLRQVGTDGDDRGWIFPGLDADGEVGAISDLRQQVHNNGKHGRFPAEDVHTLRRTYLSVAQEAGVSKLDQHVLSNHTFGSRDVHVTYISQHIDHLARCQAMIEAELWRHLKAAVK